MAKAGFDVGFTLYSRRDPVTGTVKQFVRKSTARQSSPELKAFQQCVAKGMRGYKPTGATKEERARNLRAHFAQVAQSCR